MANFLTNQTTDTVSSGQALSGPVTIHTRGTYDGATIQVEVADEDVDASYQPVNRKGQLRQPGPINLDGRGTYYARVRQTGSGPETSITVAPTQ